MNASEKIKKYPRSKKGLSDKFRGKIEDIIWERAELLKDLEEKEVFIKSTIEQLQRYYIEYKKTKRKVESNDRKLIGLIETLDDELDIKSIYKDPMSYLFPGINDR